MLKKEWKIISLLGEPYVLNILASLYDQPKRYVDLVDACPNEVTRTDKLRKLEDANLVTTKTKKIGKRTFVHYQLTDKGKTIFKWAKRIDEI
jgi:DNA-binding HxlR family transcriptional regulator